MFANSQKIFWDGTSVIFAPFVRKLRDQKAVRPYCTLLEKPLHTITIRLKHIRLLLAFGRSVLLEPTQQYLRRLYSEFALSSPLGWDLAFLWD